MKLLKKIPEAAMVAAFLKAEFASVRYSDELKKAMNKLGVADNIFTPPPGAQSDSFHSLCLRSEHFVYWLEAPEAQGVGRSPNSLPNQCVGNIVDLAKQFHS